MKKRGEIEWKSITQFFAYHDREIYALTLENEWGLQETIEVTDNHPFYVQGQGWVDSINLQVGMQIEAFAENRHLTVIALVDQQRTETTYNLEVDGFHTYFVGKMGAWAHNQNANCIQCGGGGTDVLDRIIDNSDNFPEYDIPTPFGYVDDAKGRFIPNDNTPEGRLNRAYPWAETKRQIQQKAKDEGLYNPETGNFIDPNTFEEIEGPFHYGHTTGHESWRSRNEATDSGMSQAEYNRSQQNLDYWQIEDPKSNMSHEYEEK